MQIQVYSQNKPLPILQRLKLNQYNLKPDHPTAAFCAAGCCQQQNSSVL